MPAPAAVLVTGANRGIGLEFIKQFAAMENGPQLIFAACRKAEAAEELNALPSGRIFKIALDVNDDQSVKAAYMKVTEILSTNGLVGLNMLINNAGIFGSREINFPNITREECNGVIDTNTTGVLMVTQAFYPLLKLAADQFGDVEVLGPCKAAIVNISSGAGSIADNKSGTKMLPLPLRMSKTALNQLTRTLAMDLEREGILAVSICPGWVQTDLGGGQAPLTVEQSVSALLATIMNLKTDQNGAFLNRNGENFPF